MKPIPIFSFILILCISFSSWNLSAQELQKPLRVSKYDGLDKDQLNLALAQSLRTIKTGKTLTFIGIGSAALGGIIFATSINLDDGWSGFEKGLQKATIGALLFDAGIISAAVGIPIWIVGSSRRNKIEINLAKFGPSASVNGVGVRITF